MLTLEDCIAFSDLTEEEVLAIAEHERMPEIAAAAYGEYLLNNKDGTRKICRMIIDAAQRRADRSHVQNLLHILHHFLRSHPEAVPDAHPWSRVF